MPLVRDIPHEEGVIEGEGAGGKMHGVLEERAVDCVHGQGRNFPAGGAEFHAVEAGGVAGGGVADAAGLEEARTLGEGGEAR